MSNLDEIDAWLRERLPGLLAEHRVPGAAVGVLAEGRVIDHAAGVLSRSTGVEATADSLFQVGSITKVWTATLVMQLVDDGLVDIDAPVRRYLPEFRVADEAASDAMTVRQLLCHTAIQGTVLNLVRDLQRRMALSMLFISHNLAVVRYVSDVIAVMYLGRIVECGPADDVLADPRHPYTRELLAAAPRPGLLDHEPGAVGDTEPADPHHPPPGCRFHPRCPIGPLVREDREVCRTTEPVGAGHRHHAARHFADGATDGATDSPDDRQLQETNPRRTR